MNMRKNSFCAIIALGLALSFFAACKATTEGSSGGTDDHDVNITLDPNEVVFPQTPLGYGDAWIEANLQEITVTNEDAGSTGLFWITVSEREGGEGIVDFIVEPDTLYIPGGGIGSFNIKPVLGLEAGTYRASVTVGKISLPVSIEVVDDYIISLSRTDDLYFGTIKVGDPTPDPSTITVSNIGNKPSDPLTIELSGLNSTAFILSSNSLPAIAAGGAASFTIQPADDLPVAGYSATVTVSGHEGKSKQSFNVSFGVSDGYAVSLNHILIDFNADGSVYYSNGYSPPEAIHVTIQNVGIDDTGPLNITLDGEPDAFILGGLPIDNIALDQSSSFTIEPVYALAAGPHIATVTVSLLDHAYSESLSVMFTVTEAAWSIALNNKSDIVLPPAIVGYTQAPTLPVEITNTGNQATGNLTVTLSGNNPDAFSLISASQAGAATTVNSIAKDGNASFTLYAMAGKGIDTYTATVTVSGYKVTSASFAVEFTVTDIPVTPTPEVLNGGGGTGLTAAQILTLKPVDVGVIVRYTKTEDAGDGVVPAEPTEDSALFPTGGLLVEVNNTIVNVRAFKQGWTPSTVLTETYEIDISRNFVAIADGNAYAAYSATGIGNWEAASLPTSANWTSVTYGNGKFVAVAETGNKTAYSADGTGTWSQATLPEGATTSLQSVSYGSGRFVAVSVDSKAVYSDNGINWREATGTLTESTGGYRVCYGNGRFVAIAYGGGNAAYSTDGDTWTNVIFPSYEANTYWRSLSYGNGRFVAVRSNSTMTAYSIDGGATWITSTKLSNSQWYGVSYGKGKFVAVAYNGNKTAYSTDGDTWTEVELPDDDGDGTFNLNNVSYGNGKFVTAAYNTDKAFYSTDGTSWTASTLPNQRLWVACK